MRILLIAGHGGADPGACALGRRECDLTREIVPMIQRSLSRCNVDVDIYDPKRSAYHDIIVMGYTYNFKKYDYILEVHFNKCVNDLKGDGKTTGTEIYVTPNEKIITVEELIMKNIAKLGLRNRGVKRAKMAVIMRAKAQGVSGALLEVCFMDDVDDMKVCLAKQNQIADAVADSIAEGYKLQKKGGNGMAGFSDTKGHWAEKDIQFLAEHGIVNGSGDNKFEPDKLATKAEVAVMLRRTVRYITGK